MEVRLEYQTTANCHLHDLWQVFRNIEDWHRWTGIFGNAGWVSGKPWEEGSRFFIELLFPKRVDLEVVVLKSNAPEEIVLLSHGGGYAGEQWIHFEDAFGKTTIRTAEAFVGSDKLTKEEVKSSLLQMFERWFEGLAMESEKHCLTVAV